MSHKSRSRHREEVRWGGRWRWRLRWRWRWRWRQSWGNGRAIQQSVSEAPTTETEGWATGDRARINYGEPKIRRLSDSGKFVIQILLFLFLFPCDNWQFGAADRCHTVCGRWRQREIKFFTAYVSSGSTHLQIEKAWKGESEKASGRTIKQSRSRCTRLPVPVGSPSGRLSTAAGVA